MTAARIPKPGLKASLLLVALPVLAAVLLGAALNGRGAGHDPALLPEMAPSPVTLSNGALLYVQKYEVTVAEWNTCHDRGGCSLRLRVRPGQAAGTTPATGLSHVDVGEYLRWINQATGAAFRLPTAGEWSEMAAAVLPEKADPIFTDPSLTWASAYLTEGSTPRALKPRGSFSTSPEGIADLDGSVWEWTQDFFRPGPEPDRIAIHDPKGPATGSSRIQRGGSYLCHVSYCDRYHVHSRTRNDPTSSAGNSGSRGSATATGSSELPGRQDSDSDPANLRCVAPPMIEVKKQIFDPVSGTFLDADATDGSDAGIDVVSSEYAVIAAEQTALQNLSQDLAQRMVTRVALALREQGEAPQ